MNISKLRILPAIIAIALFAVATQWVLTLPLSAQDTELAAEIADESQEKSLIDMYKAGGWAMYPLTLLSIGGFGLIVYNFLAVRPEPILNTAATVQIDEALAALDVEKAKTIWHTAEAREGCGRRHGLNAVLPLGVPPGTGRPCP